MNSDRRPSNSASAELCGAALRIPRDGAFALSLTSETLEIALSADGVAEIAASLKCPPPFRDYHTVAEEAERMGLSEKTVRNLLKEKHAPHYVNPNVQEAARLVG